MKMVNYILFFVIMILYAVFLSETLVSSSLYKYIDNMDSKVLTYSTLFLLIMQVVSLAKWGLVKTGYSEIFSVMVLYISIVSLSHLTSTPNVNIYKILFQLSHSLLPLGIFYFFFNVNKQIKPGYILLSITLLTGFILIKYFETYEQVAILSTLEGEARMSTSYIFMYLLPFFLLQHNRYIKILSFVAVTLLIFTSFKRGGILCVVLGGVVYYFIALSIKGGSTPIIKILKWALFVFLFGLGAYYIDQMNNGVILERFISIQEDGGSARDQVYEATWNLIQKNDIFETIFGHGWNTVQDAPPMYLSAHNDYLEVWYDCGIIAFSLFIFYVLKTFYVLRSMIKNKSPYSPVLALLMTFFIINSMVAHVFLYTWYFATYMASIGYIVSLEDSRLNQSIINNK